MNQKPLVVKFLAPVSAQSAKALMGVIGDAVNKELKEMALLLSAPSGSVFHDWRARSWCP
jgi:hypothetical protein